MVTTNREIIYQSLKLTEETGVPMFIFGNPGAGKTTTVNDFKNENGYELTELRVQNSPEDIFGFDVNEEGKSTLVRKYPRWMIKIIEDDKIGKKHILFIDEITTANMYVQAAMFQLIFNRGIEDIKLPDSCIIVAAGNYKANLSEEFEMLSPTLNRFCLVNLENGLSDDDISNYINRTLNLTSYIDEEKKEAKKRRSNASKKDTLLIDERGLEMEKAKAIKKFIDESIESNPEFFNADNKDFTWLKDVKGEMYGIMSPRTISYLSLLLRNMINRETFSFNHVLGLIGFGTGNEICTDGSKLSSFHKSLKRCFVNNIVEFSKNIKAKCGIEAINKEIEDLAEDLKFISAFNGNEYNKDENQSKALTGDLLTNSLSVSKKDTIARTVIEYTSERIGTLLGKLELITNENLDKNFKDNQNFLLIKDNLTLIIEDQLRCLETIINHAKNKLSNSKTDVPTSRKKIEKIKKVSFDSLNSICYNMANSKLFDKDKLSPLFKSLDNIDNLITEINIELDKF